MNVVKTRKKSRAYLTGYEGQKPRKKSPKQKKKHRENRKRKEKSTKTEGKQGKRKRLMYLEPGEEQDPENHKRKAMRREGRWAWKKGPSEIEGEKSIKKMRNKRRRRRATAEQQLIIETKKRRP